MHTNVYACVRVCAKLGSSCSLSCAMRVQPRVPVYAPDLSIEWVIPGHFVPSVDVVWWLSIADRIWLHGKNGLFTNKLFVCSCL